MNEPSSIRAQVYVPGKDKSSVLKRQLTFSIISDWIKLQGLDEYTTNGLIEMASKYPTQALPSFRKNFNIMINRVREKRRNEIRGEIFNNSKKTKEDLVEEILSEDMPKRPLINPVTGEDFEN